MPTPTLAEWLTTMSNFEERAYEAHAILVKFCKDNGGISCAEALSQTDSLWPQFPDLVADLLEVFELYEDSDDE